MKRYIIQITKESSELVNNPDFKEDILRVYSNLEKIAEEDFSSCHELIDELKKVGCGIDPARPLSHNPEFDEGLPFYYYAPHPILMGKIRVKGECEFGRSYVKEHMEKYEKAHTVTL